MKQRFDIHVVFRNKRVNQGFRGTQVETMKSCDRFYSWLFLDSDVYCDNYFVCRSQSWDVVFRGFVTLSKILIPRNATLRHFVSARLSEVTQTVVNYCVFQ